MAFLSAALLAAALSAQAPIDPGVAAFGDACLAATPVTREALADVAKGRGWSAGRAEATEELEWRDVYRAGSAIVRLDQHRATGESAGERICVVAVGPEPANWRDQVSALLVEGVPVGDADVYDTERYQLPPNLELTMWDLPGGSRIHALRTSDGLLELSVNYPAGPLITQSGAVSKDPVAYFARLCVSPRADAVEVARIIEAEGGWAAEGSEGGDLHSWFRHQGDTLQTLAYGAIQTEHGRKRVCNLTWSPGDPSVGQRLPEGLAPATGTADAEAGIYLVAESGEAIQARRFDIVGLSQDNGSTSLIFFRTEP